MARTATTHKTNVVKYKKKIAGKDEHYREHPTAGKIVVKNPKKGIKKPRVAAPHTNYNREADKHETLSRSYNSSARLVPENRDSYLRQAEHHAKLAEHYRNNPIKSKKKKPSFIKRLAKKFTNLFKGRKKKGSRKKAA